MLLRHKKTQGEDQNWCVILSPIASEIDRKKVAQKISSVFTLSLDEALDLVSNTPIIILDNLTRSIANKLKDYFRAAGAETILTNDIFQKRKCYRTVWPEPPNLSFLHDWNPITQTSKDDHQALHPEEALNEIRSIHKTDEKPAAQPSLTSIPFINRTEREQLVEEAERWRRESMKLREEAKDLRQQMERIQKENMLGFSSQDDTEWIDDKEKEIKEAQILLEHANEKYEVLRQEYASARQVYEDKISQLIQESEDLRRRAHDTEEHQKTFAQDRQLFLVQLQEKDDEIQRLTDKVGNHGEESGKFQYQLKETKEKLQMIQRAKEELDLALNSQSEQISHWRDRYDQLQPKLSALEMELRNERTLREAFEIRQREFEKNQSRLVQDLEDKTRVIQDWEGKCREMDRQLALIKEAYENQEKVLQHQLRQMEARERELESSRRQLREINTQMEHRETIQKRTQLASQLIEKESALKKLVQDQEKIENEIKMREESMRAILAQQEIVEKEIIEAKQSQRHLAELAKRDQKGRRTGTTQHEGSSSEDPQND